MTALSETMDTGAFYAALRQWPALQHDLGDVLEIGLLDVDCDLVVRGWNRWLENASGLKASQVVGRYLFDVYPDAAGTRVETAFRDAAAGTPVVLAHQFHGFVLPFDTATPGFAHMQQTARLLPLRLADGTIDGVLAVIEDVSERVARERELRDATEAAQAASKAKSEFLAAMSHELRTPLGAIIGYSDLLGGEIIGPVNPLQADRIGRIKASAFHLRGIVEEILTFARAEAGREQLHLTQTDALVLAREAISVVEPQVKSKQLKLSVELPDGPMPVVTDAVKARQVLINLLGNAVKFTDTGEISLRMDCCDSSAVRYVVSDTGPGIAVSDQQKIFEPFTQVNQSRSRVKGGTGLGLPVSVRLAHLLGGEVSLESEIGKGSTFSFSLPLQPPATDSAAGAGAV